MNIKRNCRQNLLAILAALSVFQPALGEGNPDLVGVLARITEPDKASELNLTADQLAKLSSLISDYESKALDLGTRMRAIPVEQRLFAEMDAVRKIEEQGLAILNDAQRKTVQSLRISQHGGYSLLSSELAKQLNLSPSQIEKSKNIIAGRGLLVREVGREKADEIVQQRLFEILDDGQRASWSELSGSPIPAKTATTASPASITGDEPTASDMAAFQLAARGQQSSPSDLRESSATANQPIIDASKMTGPEDGLVMNFNAAPWTEVLKWVAREAELNLQIDSYPTGTFSNRDPYHRYTVEEAIDLMNFSLLSKGYTLVKKHRILMAIDLSSAESPEVMRSFLREIAELVSPEDLDKRGNYEIIKTVFTLNRTSVEEMERQVQPLIGPQGSVVSLTAAGQLLVCEMGSKLKIIRDTIERSENPTGTRSGTLVKLSLEYVSAEEVLSIARGLLGLRDGENRADDISITTDTFGDRIFATGSIDKLQKLRDIVKELDIKPAENETKTATAEQPFIKSHQLLGSDPTTTMDVLQTTFAGQPNINMAVDPKSSNIIVRAVKSDHEYIEKIINELAGQTADFDVIPLGAIDTNAAILTLEKFYGKSPTTSTSSSAASALKGPIFYGDPAGRRILVKGTKQEVDQIKMLLGKIESSSPSTEGFDDGLRMIPLRGRAADRLLEQLDIINEARRSRIKISHPKSHTDSKTQGNESSNDSDAKRNSSPKQEVAPTANNKEQSKPALEANRSAVKMFVANYQQELADDEVVIESGDDLSAEGDVVPSELGNQPRRLELSNGEVKILQGPTGLVVTSDDQAALNEFDGMMRMLSSQMETAPAEPTIRYLKHITANAAAELVKNVIAGEQASGGSLLGDVASNMLGGGGLFGSLFGGGGSSGSSNSVSGASTIGNVIVTPDARLNALWIQANPIDALFVEDILEIIDVEQSEVDILTRGQINFIYVENTSVEDIEPVVKQVFANNITQQSGGGGGGAGGAPRQPSPEDFINMIRGAAGGGGRRGGGGAGAGPSELKEQTMTINADKKRNCLIVVGPEYLFRRVEALVKEMDEAAAADEQTIMTIPIEGDVNPALIQSTLSSVFGITPKTASPSPSATSNPGSSRPSFDPNAFQRGARSGQFGSGGGGGGSNPQSAGGSGRQFGGGQFGSGQFGGGNRGGTGNRGGGGTQGFRGGRGGN